MTCPSLVSSIAIALVILGAPAAGLASDARAIPTEFAERIGRYVDLHQAVAQLLGIDVVCDDSAELVEHDRAFATVLRQARRFARAGDIFTPDVAELIRTRLTAAMRESSLDASTAIGKVTTWPVDEGAEGPERLEVNDLFPGGFDGAIPRWLLWSLPPLPRELEYRFYGTSLALVDIRANLVVDVLEDVLPASAARPSTSPQVPCDVHPLLPACWT